MSHLAEAEATLSAMVAELASLPYSAIERLPALLDINSTHDGIEFVRYVKPLVDGRLEVVVQAHRHRRRLLFMTLGQMAAEGCWISPAGEVERMPQDKLYDYT